MQTFEIIQEPAFSIIGITCRTSNAPEHAPIDIPKLWERFFQDNIQAQIPNKISNEIFGVYCDYEDDYTKPYSLVIGCKVSSTDGIPQGMVCKTMPATSYAVFHAIGEHPKSLIATWQEIWATPLKRTYTGDFECYGEKFSKSPQQVDIYIAIQK